MLLKDILKNIKTTDIVGNPNIDIQQVVSDSRMANPSSLFVAVKGITTDGHQYIENSIEKGAVAILCQELPAFINEGVCYIRVSDPAKALGQAAANFYNNPSHQL